MASDHPYLQYVPERVCGIVSSTNAMWTFAPSAISNSSTPSSEASTVTASAASSSSSSSSSGSAREAKLVAVTGGVDRIFAWNMRTSSMELAVSDPECQSEMTVVCALNRNDIPEAMMASIVSVASGHADGSVRLWNLAAGAVVVTFHGHRKAVSAIAFNGTGVMIASGGKDKEIVVWDVTTERGLYRLRGHTNAITCLAFLDAHNMLVSASKDKFVCIWDLKTQHCVQTIVGSAGEVWSLALNPTQTRLVTGSVDNRLRVFRIKRPDEEYEPTTKTGDEFNVATFLGEFVTQSPKVSSIIFSPNGNLLCYVVDTNNVCLAKINTEAEEVHERKRKADKAAQKDASSKKPKTTASMKKEEIKEDEEEHLKLEPVDPDPDNENIVQEEIQPLTSLKSAVKVVSVAFSPDSENILVSLITNTLESYNITTSSNTTKVSLSYHLNQHGHHTDIRAISLSSDDSMVASGSGTELKIWNPKSGMCTGTMSSGYCLCLLFVPGNRHVVLGTKTGTLELYELGSASCLESIPAHQGPIWSMAMRPDKSGIATGSADHSVKFWNFDLIEDSAYSTGSKRLSLKEDSTLPLSDDVLVVKFSPNGKLIAFALLDSTIRVYHADTLNFYLSLYGHALPVMGMDISEEGLLLVSGSADKNIKIWGLDFGNCHKSIFAHNDSIMQVAFVPMTHYFFTASKDRTIKYWDADKHDEIQTLKGHKGEIWCMAVSSKGDFFVTGSHDKSVRVWARSEQQIFRHEAEEARLEEEFDSVLEDKEAFIARHDPNRPEVEAPQQKTLSTIRSGEVLLEALEIALEDKRKKEVYKKALDQFEQQQAGWESLHPQSKAAPTPLDPPPPPPEDIILQGQTAQAFVLKRLSAIPPSHVEQSVLLLSFHHVKLMLEYLEDWIRQGKNVEVCCHALTIILRIHMAQIQFHKELVPVLKSIREHASKHISCRKDVMGFNLAALRYFQRDLEQSFNISFFEEVLPEIHEVQTKKYMQQVARQHGILERPKKRVSKRMKDKPTDDLPTTPAPVPTIITEKME
ncbi:WD40 repeat [Pelomyxa schiedti]|nr:WD40 repeat [Pelomyxa schiedti]